MNETNFNDDEIIKELLASGEVEINCICHKCIHAVLDNLMSEFDDFAVNMQRIDQGVPLYHVMITLL